LLVLKAEALTEHIHAHLDVFVNGASVTVPANIGIDYVARRITPLHTHDKTGIVHIESPDARPYTLAQFFAEWGIRLDSECLDTYCQPGVSLAAWVNGAPVSGDPASVVFHAHDEIVVAAGSPPAPVPSRYSFPSGY
jgi:hypothetical protein